MFVLLYPSAAIKKKGTTKELEPYHRKQERDGFSQFLQDCLTLAISKAVSCSGYPPIDLRMAVTCYYTWILQNMQCIVSHHI